jgi:hypothetical protein
MKAKRKAQRSAKDLALRAASKGSRGKDVKGGKDIEDDQSLVQFQIQQGTSDLSSSSTTKKR